MCVRACLCVCVCVCVFLCARVRHAAPPLPNAIPPWRTTTALAATSPPSPTVPWYRERVLGRVSLGSLVYIVLLRCGSGGRVLGV